MKFCIYLSLALGAIATALAVDPNAIVGLLIVVAGALIQIAARVKTDQKA